MSEMIDAEASDLRTHVQLCAQRHAAVEKRLSRIERGIYATLGIISIGGGVSVSQLLPALRVLAGH